jgi:thiaminase/transcriptional activator TenA
VDHWTDPGFAQYVDGLGVLATPDGRDGLVRQVLTLEVAFWDMALA